MKVESYSNEIREELREQDNQFQEIMKEYKTPAWQFPEDEPVYHDRRHIKTLMEHRNDINQLL
jgi:hypothetical protein